MMEILFYIFLWWLSGFISFWTIDYFFSEEVVVDTNNLTTAVTMALTGPFLILFGVVILIVRCYHFIKSLGNKEFFRFKGFQSDDN